jgi:hypothetical protein
MKRRARNLLILLFLIFVLSPGYAQARSALIQYEDVSLRVIEIVSFP